LASHTQIRYSWFIPLPQLYTHDHLLEQSLTWITKQKVSSENIKSKEGIIKNFAKIKYDKTITFPLVYMDHRYRIHKELPYSPVYFVSTKQKKTSFEYEEYHLIKSLRFSIRVFPIGFGVISAYIDFNGIINPDMYNHYVNKIMCGSKKTSLNKYVHFLKRQLLKALFKEKELTNIKTTCIGPKLRINIIDKHISEQKFNEYSSNVLGTKNSTMKVFFKCNKKTDDQLAIHKKGIVVFTDTILTKNRRKYFRKSLDFIMDIFFGANILLPLIPSLITKTDSINNYNRFKDLISTVFLSINPEILESSNETTSLLPTAGMRVWFKSLNKIHNYSNEYITHIQEIIARMNEIRVDIWYELITSLLKENIPLVSRILLNNLKEQNFSLRELISPKIQLGDEEKVILDFLLKKIVDDYVSRFGFSTNTQLLNYKLGFCTINVIEKALGITGRDHFTFKNKLNLLSRVGLLETKAYTGPGSRNDSVQFRASPKHPYIDNFLRMKLAEESISELKLK